MASVVASRARLVQLEKAAREAMEAVERAKEAEYALQEREERRRRREWGDYSDEDDDEDEDEDDDDERDEEDFQGDENQKKKDAEDKANYADEEEEGFDFEAKQERLQQETTDRQRKAIEAIRLFITEFEACVKADSLPFLTELQEKMHATLPIELRDMIYTHLDIQERANPGDPAKHFPIYFRKGDYNPNFHSFDPIDDDYKGSCKAFENSTFNILGSRGWLLNPEFVGHGVARDIAQIFYAVNNFNTEVELLEELLISDRTNTGLKPYEHIRQHISVSVTTTMCNGSNERAWQTTENEIAFLNGIYTQLNHLTLLTHKSDVSVDIWVSTSPPMWEDAVVGERRFYNIMESIRAPIYDLIHSGVNITVNHTTKRTLQTQKISEEPMNYFRMSKEEWEAEKRSHGPDWMPSANFILQEEIEQNKEDIERRLKKLLEERGTPSL